MFTRQDITTTVETSPPQLGMNGKGRTWARKARYSPQPFEPDTRDELSVIRRIIHASINSMLLTSLRLIRLLARLEDVLTDGKFVLDEWSVSKFRSRRNVDSFLTTFPHAMFPEMLISCWRPVKQFWRLSSHNVLFLISCLLLIFLSWVRFTRGKHALDRGYSSDIPPCLMFFLIYSSTTLRVPQYFF